MLRLFLILILILLLPLALSRSKPGDRKLEVFKAAITSAQLTGGGVLKLKNEKSGVVETIEFKEPPFVVNIPDGTWSFHFVGFAGPGLWEGNIFCGALVNLELGASDSSVSLTVSNSCGNEPYLTMVNDRTPRFNFAKFDQAKFAP